MTLPSEAPAHPLQLKTYLPLFACIAPSVEKILRRECQSKGNDKQNKVRKDQQIKKFNTKVTYLPHATSFANILRSQKFNLHVLPVFTLEKETLS